MSFSLLSRYTKQFTICTRFVLLLDPCNLFNSMTFWVTWFAGDGVAGSQVIVFDSLSHRHGLASNEYTHI
jgi:hypothetical protein